MKSRGIRIGLGVALVGLGLATIGAIAAADGRRGRVGRRVSQPGPREIVEHDLVGFTPDARGGSSHIVGSDGRRFDTTIDTQLQLAVRRYLRENAVPYAAMVALEPSTGRVLAYTAYSAAGADENSLLTDATPPAASIFKIVTGAALLEHGISHETRVCFTGGASRLEQSEIDRDVSQGAACTTLADAMGSSTNAVFAKLADRNLPRAQLDECARRFGFGRAEDFDVRLQPSTVDIPGERLEYARTAAGFWRTHMSPVHAALIAATVANRGEIMRPHMVDAIRDAAGHVIATAHPRALRRVISPETAASLAVMMRTTVTRGTSRRAFHDANGNAFVPGVAIAGKTGTLTGANPYRAYTWWVGFAPVESPRIAMAALVVNTDAWRIKANQLARYTLQEFFRAHPSLPPAQPVAAR